MFLLIVGVFLVKLCKYTNFARSAIFLFFALFINLLVITAIFFVLLRFVKSIIKNKQNYVKSTYTYFVIAASVLIAAACAPTKNTALTRNYHNVVSRYNIFFNGNEAFKQGMNRAEKEFQEPFNDILPVFFFTQPSAMANVQGEMDRAITKSTKLIKKHSITARPKQTKAPSTDKEREFYYRREYNNWIDDAYLLLGKALFMKQNYFEAQKNFLFLTAEYRNNPEVRYTATLWLAHTKVAMQQYDDAKDVLDKVADSKDFPEHLRSEFFAIYADIFIRMGKYEEAITYMQLAIDYTTNKKTLVRYHYILAQLYKEMDINEKAVEQFAAVLSLNPNYEFAFNARISQATAFEGGRGSSATTIAALKKLLKDKKNADFKDQIYFALANVYIAENDEENALTFYKKSVETSAANKQQKAMSLLAIGNIYYNQRNYLAAQPFYDSAMMVLPQEYRNYATVQAKSNKLNVLARYHSMAHTEDSLQRMAKMTEKERNNYIDNIIRRLNEEDRQKQEQQLLETQNALMYGQQDLANSMQNGQAGKWYFYNETAVRLGRTEFKQRWGDRTLEDNWRRSARGSTFAAIPDETTDASGDEKTNEQTVAKVTDTRTRQYYLQNLPLTDSAMALSTRRLEDGLFNKGMTYMNLIGDNTMAIATLEEYVKRFPNSTYTPIALYYLYKLYEKEQNFAKADSYKAQVIKQYPHTNYAKALSNPDFQKDIKAQEKQLEKLYADAYKAYTRGDYATVLQLSKDQQQKFPDAYLTPQFQFLRAMSEGRLAGIPTLQAQLTDFVKQYPKAENTPLAKSLLNYIAQNDSTQIAYLMNAHIARTSQTTTASARTETPQEEEKEVFITPTPPPFYYVLAVKADLVDINQVKFNAINYNLDYFTNFDFDIQTKSLSSKINLLVISPFESLNQAMNYFDLVNYNQEIFTGIEKVFTSHFIISAQNYQALVQSRDVDAYLKFFKEHYSR